MISTYIEIGFLRSCGILTVFLLHDEGQRLRRVGDAEVVLLSGRILRFKQLELLLVQAVLDEEDLRHGSGLILPDRTQVIWVRALDG